LVVVVRRHINLLKMSLDDTVCIGQTNKTQKCVFISNLPPLLLQIILIEHAFYELYRRTRMNLSVRLEPGPSLRGKSDEFVCGREGRVCQVKILLTFIDRFVSIEYLTPSSGAGWMFVVVVSILNCFDKTPPPR